MKELQEQMDLQLISTLSAAITMAYKAEIKMEKKQKTFSARRNSWDNRSAPFQRKNTEFTKQIQANNRSTSKTKDDPQQKNIARNQDSRSSN